MTEKCISGRGGNFASYELPEGGVLSLPSAERFLIFVLEGSVVFRFGDESENSFAVREGHFFALDKTPCENRCIPGTKVIAYRLRGDMDRSFKAFFEAKKSSHSSVIETNHYASLMLRGLALYLQEYEENQDPAHQNEKELVFYCKETDFQMIFSKFCPPESLGELAGTALTRDPFRTAERV